MNATLADLRIPLVLAPLAGDPGVYADYVTDLRANTDVWGVEPGEPRYGEDDWDEKLELLLRKPVAVVSFTFGCPAPETLRDLKRAGCETWVTATLPTGG